MPPLIFLGIGFRHRYHYITGGFRQLLHYCLFHSPQHSWGFEFGNHTNYTDPSVIEFTTIRETLYLGMHNDVSFLISSLLNL